MKMRYPYVAERGTEGGRNQGTGAKHAQQQSQKKIVLSKRKKASAELTPPKELLGQDPIRFDKT